MNNDLDNFAALEERIVGLVEAFGTLRNEKAMLGEKLSQKETEIRELSEKLARLQQEREAAREKVESLLNRLDLLISQK